jgi:surface antigen
MNFSMPETHKGGFVMKQWNAAVALFGILSLVSTGLVGCGGVYAGQSARNTNQVGGGLIGGVAGGILGSQIGGGTGKIAAIIGGTLAGVALGSYMGGYMDRSDQQRVSRTLETQPAGQASAWRNPDTGHHYQVTPVRTYQAAEGRYCREFTTQVNIGGRVEDAYGTACRMPDGSWQIQDQVSGPIGSGPDYGSTTVVVHEPVYLYGPSRSGPPPWAPAHGYRAKYTYSYYPAHQVYYDSHRNLYFYFSGKQWRTSSSYSSRSKLGSAVFITMRTDRPYHYHSDVRRHYPPGKSKGRDKDRDKDRGKGRR